MQKEITVKIYLKSMKKPLILALANYAMTDKLDDKLCDDSNIVSFGCVCFAKNEFVCYTVE